MKQKPQQRCDIFRRLWLWNEMVKNSKKNRHPRVRGGLLLVVSTILDKKKCVFSFYFGKIKKFLKSFGVQSIGFGRVVRTAFYVSTENILGLFFFKCDHVHADLASHRKILKLGEWFSFRKILQEKKLKISVGFLKWKARIQITFLYFLKIFVLYVSHVQQPGMLVHNLRIYFLLLRETTDEAWRAA